MKTDVRIRAPRVWRVLLIFLSCLLFSIGMTNAQSRLVAYWPFNELSGNTLIDASGNGNTGYDSNATRVSGMSGGALSFNGTTSNFAYALNSASLNIASQITIECWANVRQTSPVSGSGQTFIRKETAYVLGIGSGGRVGFQVGISGGGWTGSWTLSQQTIQASSWYHIAGVWNGQTLKVYVNGVEDANTYSAVGTIALHTNNVYMGKFYESNYECLNGTIDELKIYDYALPADSIAAHYNASFTPAVVLIPYTPDPTFNRQPLLRWFANTSISVYRIQIATVPNFSSLFITVPTSDTFYLPTANLPFGTNYWRVRNESDSTMSSRILSVTIQDSLAPVIIPYYPDPTRERRPVLKWHPVNGTASYTIQINTTPSFTTPLISDAVSDTAYPPSVNLPIGYIYWHVKSNRGTQYSSVDTFLILNDSIPLLIPIIPDTQINPRPLFAWYHAAGASSYRIQIDLAGNFTSPYISLPLTDTTYLPSADLPVGRIFWRVGAVSNLTRYSIVDTFWIAGSGVNFNQSWKKMVPPAVSLFPIHNGVRVSYSLEKQGAISLDIFSIMGNRVTTAYKGTVSAGTHTLVWNGTDKRGNGLPNGSYLAVFTINERTFSQKILIVR